MIGCSRHGRELQLPRQAKRPRARKSSNQYCTTGFYKSGACSTLYGISDLFLSAHRCQGGATMAHLVGVFKEHTFQSAPTRASPAEESLPETHRALYVQSAFAVGPFQHLEPALHRRLGSFKVTSSPSAAMSSSSPSSPESATTSSTVLALTTPFVQPSGCSHWTPTSLAGRRNAAAPPPILMSSADPSCYPSGMLAPSYPQYNVYFSPAVCPSGWIYNHMSELLSYHSTAKCCQRSACHLLALLDGTIY